MFQLDDSKPLHGKLVFHHFHPLLGGFNSTRLRNMIVKLERISPKFGVKMKKIFETTIQPGFPNGKWLITMVKKPKDRVVGPLPNGLNDFKMGVANYLLTGMIHP